MQNMIKIEKSPLNERGGTRYPPTSPPGNEKTVKNQPAWLTADHLVLDCNHHFGGTSKALQQEKNRLP